ncbi:MAG TPA: copper resistance protein CopC [Candidatus Corynebacterium gallistercoris]|uniref:Copper resistance protein CopC n=1 Tax=Candidatus Corynebacterium gallistercoris TaxID=2838530 RepID=A0A9D1RYU0_9CORY|nr:copper resistance protein CopC [Candidatus Corynebacterium gallistercoris]
MLGGASVIGFAPVASAHDAVLSSTPDEGETISELPSAIVLDFSGEPQEGFNTVSLSRDGEVVFSGEPTTDGHKLTLELPGDVNNDPGEYTVGYQITSSDGHATRGGYTFTLSGDGTTPAPTSEGSSVDEQGEQGEPVTGVPSWLLPLGGIVVISGALVLAIQRYRGLKDD